jgi:hypothetical protein
MIIDGSIVVICQTKFIRQHLLIYKLNLGSQNHLHPPSDVNSGYFLLRDKELFSQIIIKAFFYLILIDVQSVSLEFLDPMSRPAL